MILYTYDCPNCGRVRIAQDMEKRQEAICPTCETKVQRCTDDFCMNLSPPFQEILLFGHGGKNGLVVHSRQEKRKALNDGWKNDMNFDGDRTAMPIKEYDKLMGFDTEALDRGIFEE